MINVDVGRFVAKYVGSATLEEIARRHGNPAGSCGSGCWALGCSCTLL